MNDLKRTITEAELDADALADKLRSAAKLAGIYDAHAARRLTDMADWIDDVIEELAQLAGHPRTVPDLRDEVRA